MRLGGPVDTSQIEDRRGAGRGLAVGGGGLGVVGLILALVFGLSGGNGGGGNGDLNQILRQLQPDAGAAQGNAQPLDCSQGASESTACFVTGVVNDVQATWAKIFQQQGRSYRETKLVLYTQATPTSGCGEANSAVGPFYCPGDEKVYLDLGFFQELRDRFGAPGDFAQAYVIAHEFGHHVQNLLGTMEKVDRVRQRDRSQDHPLSVRLELQADCYAGVWAHESSVQPDPQDFTEALDAAASVGDDRLQKQAGQRVNQDTWTHGSSAERQQWFQTGAKSGNPADCNTFAQGAVP
jgi:uncharacterized protein